MSGLATQHDRDIEDILNRHSSPESIHVVKRQQNEKEREDFLKSEVEKPRKRSIDVNNGVESDSSQSSPEITKKDFLEYKRLYQLKLERARQMKIAQFRREAAQRDAMLRQ